MSRNLRQPVVIENRAGAGGAVASTALMKMPGDGYNLVATTSTTMTLDPMVAKLGFGVERLCLRGGDRRILRWFLCAARTRLEDAERRGDRREVQKVT